MMRMMMRFALMILMTSFCLAGLSIAEPGGTVRAQRDSIGFAVTPADLGAVLAASHAVEGEAVVARRAELGLSADMPWIAAVMPHDDYLYAGPTDLHLLPGMKAKRWILVGVCHACRRLGVRDRLIFDSHSAWNVAGTDHPVDVELRDELLAALGDDIAYMDDERQDAEHSVEALVPWLRAAVPDARFVSILVPTMDSKRRIETATALAAALADICRRENWQPGVDLAILVSADAVHYGCEGWGERGGYHPFGCETTGHTAGRRQDITLAEATLAGPLTEHGPAAFDRLVRDPQHPEYPYRITWCGVYSIPFGLECARLWQAALDGPSLVGHLLRYGDSVTDGRLDVPGTQLGLTAPANLEHWVGYPALGWVAGP